MNPAAVAVKAAEIIYFKHLERKYKAYYLEGPCGRCSSEGRHKFKRMEPTAIPLKGKKIFICRKCKAEMYETGKVKVTFFDRVDAFIQYPQLMRSINELESIGKKQRLSPKNKKEVLSIRKELLRKDSDKKLCTKKIRALINEIKK